MIDAAEVSSPPQKVGFGEGICPYKTVDESLLSIQCGNRKMVHLESGR